MKTTDTMVLTGIVFVVLMTTGVFSIHYQTQQKEKMLHERLDYIDSRINELENELTYLNF